MENDKPCEEPAFRGISKTHSAFLIWRVENLKVVSIPKDSYGTFYDGDSYIIYSASEYGKYIGPGVKPKEIRGRLEMHIHFWLGKETSQDESAVAAFKTVELDNYLGGSPVQHREVSGHESPRFKAYFKQGIRVLVGGVATGLNTVNNNLEPRLFRVKGRRIPLVTQMPSVSWDYFTSGDVFIVDTKDVVFVWVGKKANSMEKLQAAKVAVQLKDEHNAVSVVFVDQGRETDLTPPEQVLLGFYLDISPNSKRVLPDSKDDDAQVETEARTSLKLYKCSEVDGLYKVVEVKTGPLYQNDLDSEDSFVIDNGPHHIWVWIGKRASQKERIEAMRNAHGFVKKKGYPSHTQVSRVVDGGEPMEFKALFNSWVDREVTKPLVRTTSSFGLTPTNFEKLDGSLLHSSPQIAAQEQLLDNGSGVATIWRLHDSKVSEVNEAIQNVFFSKESYIVSYSYKVDGVNKRAAYLWKGQDSTVSHSTMASVASVQIDHFGECDLTARIHQGKEPPHFLSIFKGKFIIMAGDHTDLLPSTFLLQVCGHKLHNLRSIQVALKASSLNSHYVFVLCKKGGGSFVWCGKGSTGDEREMAKQLLTSLSKGESSVLFEGQEKDDFWECLGGKEAYQSERKAPQPTPQVKTARVFHCSNASGKFRVEEIMNFSQGDLVSEDVMLLDTHDTIFIWVGKDAQKEEKTKTLQFASEYLDSDPSGRDPLTPIIQFNQHSEPPIFIGFFDQWDPGYWNKSSNFEEMRKELDEKKPHIRVDLMVPDNTPDFDECEKFPFKTLLEKDPDKLPEGVDLLHKELHLTEDEFKEIFKMSYDSFKVLPTWRQKYLKKEVGLF